VDLMEIGAGGGSIARVSRMGTLQVGPQSSGADPGPVCYGRGGTEPCVTDADLLLGYLDADYFLGGEMKLCVEAARRAVDQRIAGPLGVTPTQAIWGIHDLINETMAGAARTHIAEKGGNPRVVTVVAFGGAGPVHAYGLARKLGPRGCSCHPTPASGRRWASSPPPGPSTWFAVTRSPSRPDEFEAVETLFARMEAEGLACCRAGRTRRSASSGRWTRGSWARVRRPACPSPRATFRQVSREQMRRRFDEVYERLYGRTYPDAALELVSFRVRARLPERLLELPVIARRGDLARAIKGQRPAYSPAAGTSSPSRYTTATGSGRATPSAGRRSSRSGSRPW